MNWTMPYPWRSRRDSVRRINMSREPGNESFFCALRPIPRILSLQRRDDASQVQIPVESIRNALPGRGGRVCRRTGEPAAGQEPMILRAKMWHERDSDPPGNGGGYSSPGAPSEGDVRRDG